MEDETTAPRRGSRHHSRQSARSPAARPSLPFEAASTTSTGRPQRASPASSRPLRCPTQPDAPGDNAGQPRDRIREFQEQPTDDSPESRGTTTCCGAIACSSWTGSRTAHFIPFMACMAFMRSCDWQGKGARLTSQRPRPRHPCLESLSETAHFIAFMAFASLAYQPRPKCWLNSLHAHMTFIAFNLQL